jgi:hypothetical protein
MRGRYLWLWLLGLAVGWFEASVVVYLRKLYYPAGFAFPIVMAPSDIALVVAWPPALRSAPCALLWPALRPQPGYLRLLPRLLELVQPALLA